MCRCHFSRTNETGVASMIGRLALAAASAVLIVVPALAQNQPAAPRAQVRGTIEKVAANLTVKSREGGDVKVAVTDTTRIQSLVKKTLTDVKAGDFLASTGMKGTDGKIHAIEVRILPQATPDGGRQYDWDRGSGSVMTNATVGTVTEAPQGKLVHVKFKDGESEYADTGPRSWRQEPVEAGRRGVSCRPKGSGRHGDGDFHLRREGRHQAANVTGASRGR
jgi:hypothetical protein